MGVLHSFSIKNIFYNKIDLILFYFHVTKYYSKYKCSANVLTKVVILLQYFTIVVIMFVSSF